ISFGTTIHHGRDARPQTARGRQEQIANSSVMVTDRETVPLENLPIRIGGARWTRGPDGYRGRRKTNAVPSAPLVVISTAPPCDSSMKWATWRSLPPPSDRPRLSNG